MLALEKARELIHNRPDDPDSRNLLQLILCLESGEPFNLASLYALSIDHFDLAMDILIGWRLHRHTGVVRARPREAVTQTSES